MTNPVNFAAHGDADGQEWVERLPALIADVCEQWDLTITSSQRFSGYHAVVLPVDRGDEHVMLKLTWPTDRAIAEAAALRAWNGVGAVQLIDADAMRGALLLERLVSRVTLESVEIFAAAAAAGHLLRQLAIPAPAGFPSLRSIAANITRSLMRRRTEAQPVLPSAWIETACSIADTLGSTAMTDRLIHADLHYGNVLQGDRALWLAIDPKPVAGEPEHAVPELLWTRTDELRDAREIRHLLDVIVRHGGLDADRARRWAIVRCVDYWFWGRDHGLTEDPRRCQRILDAFM